MKTSVRLLQLLTGSTLLASVGFTFAGTWSDDFSENVLGSDWCGDRAYFSILKAEMRPPAGYPEHSP